MTQQQAQEIFARFRYQGEFLSAVPYGEGHINHTFLITTTARTYILQQVNSKVFRRPEQVMNNIVLVTAFLREKIQKNGGDPDRETLTLVPTVTGENYIYDGKGDLYRLYLNVEDSVCYQTAENAELFCESARSFAKFQLDLSNFDAEQLTETIPDFHNTRKRYCKLKTVTEQDPVGRLQSAKDAVEFALEREGFSGVIVDGIAKGEIPLRVTHNDTKLNNILMDRVSGKGLCVVDLDTVMPGSLLYDFGDSIRFGASSAPEDERDLDRVYMLPELYSAYTKGYLEVLGKCMTQRELELLPFSAMLITLECGVRFLTDYLEGDVYFKTAYPDHNLVRAKNQFRLVADMEARMQEMKKITEEFVKIYC